MDQYKEAFKEEAHELLAELETSLLELEERPEDSELIDRVFRAMHTIKGSGAMFGFTEISEFTHEVETVFDRVRNQEIKLTKVLVSITLRSRDHILAMLNSDGDAGDEHAETSVEIIAALKEEVAGAPEIVSGEGNSEPESSAVTAPAHNCSYWIRFRPALDLFFTGTNPVCLLNELRELGDCEIVAQCDKLPALQKFDPEKCYIYWDVILTTKQGIEAINGVFIFVEDESDIEIKVIDEEGVFDSSEQVEKLGEILVKHGDLLPEELQRVLQKQTKIGDLLVDEGLVDDAKVQSALTEQKHVMQKRRQRQQTESVASIRVASEKLDSLVDLVGELVTVQSHLSQMASEPQHSELLTISEEVERLTAELRDNTMSIRMLAIGTTFGKLKRLVRDLTNELGKEVEMLTDGSETELDKTVIERLNDPLVHIIRNSIDHGIESPDAREKAGKPKTGTVILSAAHSGANVIITISDDGAGLNAEAIRAKAVDKGLITADADLSEKEVFALILAPGFSTAQKVTNLSGRGVGMDVVKRAIEALRGSIEIQSKQGIGTTITLKLPLTLAIIEGLLIKVAAETFVIPLAAVEECVELSRADVAKTNGRKVTNVRGDIVPYIHLRERFSIDGEHQDIEQIVIVRIEGQRVGLVVDEVVGEHQTVIKSLGRFYKDVQEISGATIRGDGAVALILDLAKVLEGAKIEEESIVEHANSLIRAQQEAPVELLA